MKYSKLFGLMVAVAALVCADVNAETIVNPDDNTLWIENGKNIKNGAADAADEWRAGLKLLPDPAGDGFIVDSNSDVDKKNCTGRYIKVAPEYPWLVYEITEVAPIPGKYIGFTIPMPFGPHSEFAGNIPSGIFVRNINDRGDVTAEKTVFMSIYACNSKTSVKYIKMVKKPDYYVEMKSDDAAKKQKFELGDNVTFKVYLKETAEDVSLRFNHVYTMPQLSINGEQAVQLKSEDGSDGKIWSAAVPLKSISGNYKLIKPGALMIKTVILGGQVKVPIWGTNTYSIELDKK